MRTIVALLLAVATALTAEAQPRPVTLDDAWRVQDVGDPQVSPDGEWVLYTLTTTDVAADKRDTDVWIVKWDGSERRRLTFSAENENAPRWSPDGRYISFLSSRAGGKANGNQVWVLERAGGEARQLTELTGRIQSYAWSPETKRLVLVYRDEPADDGARNAKPIVIDKYQFKRDGQGYLTGNTRTRVYLYDIAARKAEALTADSDYEENNPEWSPDGTRIAFVSNHDAHWERTRNSDVFVVEAKPGSRSRRLRSITFTVADDQTQYLARIVADGGAVERLTSGPRVVGQPSSEKGRTALTASSDLAPGEVYAVETAGLRKLTAHNDPLVAELQLVPAEDLAFKSKDGVEVHALLTKPRGYQNGRRYPTLFRIHGGPTGQDAHSYNFERQWFAAHGYAVINVNYRGSSGRGAKFSEAIFADWGNLEVADLLAAADHAVAIGIADPQRLGIGGWSYGGVLTDYVIASDTRFKAAISGAGSANHISLYGHDQYTFLYDSEFGPPWKDTELWLKYSYPFFKADRIKTPTLFMGGQDDFNVPILGSEQMYQALKTLNVDTQLVVYPGQNHGIAKLAFQRDRFERYLAWYDKYLKGGATVTSQGQ